MITVSSRRHSDLSAASPLFRLKVFITLVGCVSLIVGIRLFYWQIIKGPALRAEAFQQYQRTVKVSGQRGSLYTADGHLLVGTTQVYRLYAEPPKYSASLEEMVEKIRPFILENDWEYQHAASDTDKLTRQAVVGDELRNRLNKPENKWVQLPWTLTEAQRDKLAEVGLKGIGTTAVDKRLYPEASMAAHLTGFVGKNQDGEDVGYFGLEGALDKELRGRSQSATVQTDGLGMALAGYAQLGLVSPQGRDVTLTIRRDVQNMLEQMLEEGVKKYGAKTGEVVVMEPSTGRILGLATYPSYDQASFSQFPTEVYKNPAAAATFEPGSIFKPLTVAAGIDAGLINPDTICTRCEGPRLIDGYTIKTWNNVYSPDVSMRDALAKSDNVAMIFVAEKLGIERFKQYIEAFGINQRSNIELQEDTAAPFPTKWGPVELATRSFGQGISTTTLQMIRALGAIANQGKMMRPLIIEKVTDPISQKEIVTQPVVEGQPISPATAQQVVQMMVHAASKGEAQWTASRTHTVAGKTGTSQIAVNGAYDPEKTIASFVGFAPAASPKFIMLVKLTEPSKSPWAAETAAPLWYAMAQKLYLLLNIPPDKQITPSLEPTTASGSATTPLVDPDILRQ